IVSRAWCSALTGPNGSPPWVCEKDAEDAGSGPCAGTQEDERHQMKRNRKGSVGSSFDDFLREEKIYEDVTARAIKRVIARRLDALMQEEGLTKTELARRMHTSRAQLDRLLDPDNESVTLGTLARAAQAIGRQLRFELV